MIDVALCIGIDHNPLLVALAVLICFVGAFAVTEMFDRLRGTAGAQRLGWAFLTAVVAGATVWCTHFVAMLAFRARVAVDLDPVLTIVSLIVAIAGTQVGLLLATAFRGRFMPIVGGTAFGLAFSTMHYVGMAAYRVDGIVQWRWDYVIASVLCAVGFSAAAFHLICAKEGRSVRLAATGLLVTAIATLHFVGMTGFRVIPFAVSTIPLDHSDMVSLALATALIGLFVILAGAMTSMIDRHTRTDAMQRLHHMAMNDALTGLPNRASFKQSLAARMARGKSASPFALLAIDLNRFKEINDLHGHKAGDDVLILLADRMRAELRDGDVAARLGGDEFVALISFDDRTDLVMRAARLDAAIKAPLKLSGFEAHVGASVGVAIYPDDADDLEALASNADLAMYRAKSARAAAPCYYDAELDEAIRDRRELANDLRHAIAEGRLDVHYQLQASVSTGEVTGYEALVRWTHPERGAIPPSVFVPIAEENSLILQLGEWVLRRACTDAMSWEHQSKVAVNVSPLQLAHPELPDRFLQILLDTGLPARRLEIELTESAIIADRDRALHVLRRIKAMGIGVALDDFGTGYSSLETLRAFTFDKIKLDRLFVAELGSNPQATAIIRAVLALGKSMSIPVLAEGIETSAQLAVLQDEGCDEAQGFLLGRPARSITPNERRIGQALERAANRGRARKAISKAG